MTRADIPVKCTRCRSEHMESERISRPRLRKSTSGMVLKDLVCPHCGAKSCYDMTPQVAWCWASGLIQVGDKMPADGPAGDGAIKIAEGPKYALKSRLSVVARHGYGSQEGQLLVPGVPEADSQDAKVDALINWLKLCGYGKPRDGVVFSKEAAA